MADDVRPIRKDVKVKVPDYSQRRKIEVVSAYQDNSYDLELTAKQTGVSESLIKRWHRELGRSVFKGKNQIEVVAGQLEAEKSKIASQVSLDLVRVRQIGLERLEHLIMKSDSIEMVTKAIDALTRAIKEDVSSLPGIPAGKNATYNLINQQFNILKQKKDKNNEADHD